MRRLFTLLVLPLVALACNGQSEPVTLTLISHDSFADAVDESTFAAFTEETGVAVEVLAAGDAGAMVNQAILTKDNPLADVLFGVDDTFLQRAVGADIFEDYRSPSLPGIVAGIPTDYDSVTPIDYGDVCINYDREAFASTPPPETLDELTILANQLVVEDPTLSSPGLAFLLATIDRYGEGWVDYWAALRDNGVLVAPGWSEAYYGEFSGGGGEGDRPLVVSYASSPPAEVIFADPPVEEAPTAVMTDGCYRQTEFAGILAGTEHAEEAGELIDFMLSRPFQETIPLTWFVYPVLEEASLPPEFVENTAVPSDPVQIDPAVIDENREEWLEEWSEIFG
ncbi:MAG: thiamine ABC transporter substrate-binding protein [bacterium]